MRIFLTGASGFVGSAVLPELLAAGHRVLGLARSDTAARALAAAGADVHRGSVDDPATLQSGAAACDAVIHTAFIHDFANYKNVCEVDRRAIEALGAALTGSQRPLVVTSGTGLLARDRLALETDRLQSGPDALPRVATEEAADAVAARGVRVAVVRLPPSVHGDGDHGFVPLLIQLARDRATSAYVGEGTNRWPAVHRLDAGDLYRRAVEHDFTAGARFHGVAEEGVPFRTIAETIARRLDLPTTSLSPEAAAAHFGWFTHFARLDVPASSAWTREQLGWRPRHPDLLADLDRPAYFAQ